MRIHPVAAPPDQPLEDWTGQPGGRVLCPLAAESEVMGTEAWPRRSSGVGATRVQEVFALVWKGMDLVTEPYWGSFEVAPQLSGTHDTWFGGTGK